MGKKNVNKNLVLVDREAGDSKLNNGNSEKDKDMDDSIILADNLKLSDDTESVELNSGGATDGIVATNPDACHTHGTVMFTEKDGIRTVSVCEKCIIDAHVRREQAVVRSNILGVQGNIDKSNIPHAFAATTLASYKASTEKQRDIQGKVFDFISNENVYGIIINGKQGTGKTMLASIIGIECIRRGDSVLYVPHSEFQMVYEGFLEKDIGDYIKPDLLIIDNLDPYMMHGNGGAIVIHILNARYILLKPTIIAINSKHSDVSDEIDGIGRRGCVIELD